MDELLAVSLNLVDGPGFCLLRALPGFFLGAPLTEEVPALVELLFNASQATLAVAALITLARSRVAQFVLLLHKRLDASQNILIVHDNSFADFSEMGT
jgi:hypothetical protein